MKRELDDTYESSSEKRRKERNSEDLYEADSVQEKMPEWGDGKYKMPEQTGKQKTTVKPSFCPPDRLKALPVL